MEINDEENNNKNDIKLNISTKISDSQNNNILDNKIKLKSYQGLNKRYYQNENEDNTLIKNEINYIDIFNDVVLSIDKIIFEKEKNEEESEENSNTFKYRKSSFMYDSINEEKIDYNHLSSELYNILFKLHSENKNIIFIKNRFDNNLSQYYLSSGLILVSIEIINIYHKIYLHEVDGEDKFFEWLINDNNEGQNLLEAGISMQATPREQISFYKHIFDLIEKSNNKKIIYKILEKRKENIFLLSVKEEKLFLLLFLYDKIKKYYPSSNPLDIKNRLGLAPLHFGCYYLNRDIVNILLTLDCKVNISDNNGNIPLHFAIRGGDLSIVKKILLYGGNRNKLNNKNLSPIDYANKYGNYSMKNLFSNKPMSRIEKIKGRKHDNLLILLFIGCFLLKFWIYHYFWKSYIFDIISFLIFIYFILLKKDYYLNPNIKLPSKDISIENLFIECDYDKNKIKKICPKCKIIKPINMKHCMVCDLCVDEFDHHCFWINKCINNNIYMQFIIFLIVLLSDLVINFIIFIFEIKNFLKIIKTENNNLNYLKIISLLIYLFIFSFGILMISMMLFERIKAKLSSKTKLTLEENLINKKTTEDECEDENKIKIINSGDKAGNINNKLKLKEENKEEEIDINNILK